MIETKDLILKQGSADDWQDLYRNLWSHGEVFRYMFTKPSPTKEHAMKKTAAYAQMHKEVNTEFFVYDKSARQAIGTAGLKEIQPGVYTVTDIALCPDFHGKGYGKQILTAFISLAFDALGAIELHYDCFRQNEASKRLARSCGFTYMHSEEAELTKDGEKVTLAALVDKGYKLGIIANQNFGTAERLEMWGLRQFFEVIAASAEIGYAKPNKEIFEKAFTLTGCCAEESVMVGDRLDNDIVPAKAFGMKTVWIKNGLAKYQSEELGKGIADYQVNKLSELLCIL